MYAAGGAWLGGMHISIVSLLQLNVRAHSSALCQSIVLQ